MGSVTWGGGWCAGPELSAGPLPEIREQAGAPGQRNEGCGAQERPPPSSSCCMVPVPRSSGRTKSHLGRSADCSPRRAEGKGLGSRVAALQTPPTPFPREGRGRSKGPPRGTPTRARPAHNAPPTRSEETTRPLNQQRAEGVRSSGAGALRLTVGLFNTTFNDLVDREMPRSGLETAAAAARDTKL